MVGYFSNIIKPQRKPLTRKHRLVIAKGYGMKCAKCGRKFKSHRDFEIDHIIPKSQGGSDEITNLRPICKIKCHRPKTRREAKQRAKAKFWF